MQLYTFEQAGTIHNTWYNKVYSCVSLLLYIILYYITFWQWYIALYYTSQVIQHFPFI